MELFDTHSHYNDEKFEDDREEIIDKTYKSGVTKFTCVGYDLESSIKAVEISNKHKFIYSIVGISPNDITNDIEKHLVEIEKMAKNKKVVAIGEIGLDYYWNKDNKEQQKQAFIKQIELANKLNLPIVIHTRDAIFDTLDILKNTICPNKKGIIHCCPMNTDLIKGALKLGFYISFAGPITFKNAHNADEAIKLVPIDKILIETDSPYLAPEPLRGTRNDSRNVIYMAKKIAKTKEKTVEEIAKITYENALKIFNLN